MKSLIAQSVQKVRQAAIDETNPEGRHDQMAKYKHRDEN
jgi:hypothetical protein